MPSNRAIAARAERSLAFVSVAGLVLLGVVFASGLDMFRAPKEAAMRAQAIISVFALAVAIVYGGTSRIRELLRERAVIALLGGAVLWSIVTALTSQQRLLSAEALVTIFFSVVLFVAVWYVSRDIPVAALLVLVPVAVINTILGALQEFGIWNPFDFRSGGLQTTHLKASALLGNPNDVGGYLSICAVILFAASGFLHGRRRWIAAIGAAAALGGVIVSQSRTAVLTVAAAAVFFGFRRSRKAALIVALLVVILLFVIAPRVDMPALTRVSRIPAQLISGDWEILFSERLPAFAVAYAMFHDHPFLGVGPGAYKYLYMPYRIHLRDVYPEEIMRGAGVNFAEAHNDHLQLLAETGLPGYALFVAACVLIALRARGSENDDERAHFAARLAVPFVITVAVLALAFFPLQIASTRHLLVTMSALILGWSRT